MPLELGRLLRELYGVQVPRPLPTHNFVFNTNFYFSLCIDLVVFGIMGLCVISLSILSIVVLLATSFSINIAVTSGIYMRKPVIFCCGLLGKITCVLFALELYYNILDYSDGSETKLSVVAKVFYIILAVVGSLSILFYTTTLIAIRSALKEANSLLGGNPSAPDAAVPNSDLARGPSSDDQFA